MELPERFTGHPGVTKGDVHQDWDPVGHKWESQKRSLWNKERRVQWFFTASSVTAWFTIRLLV